MYKVQTVHYQQLSASKQISNNYRVHFKINALFLAQKKKSNVVLQYFNFFSIELVYKKNVIHIL